MHLSTEQYGVLLRPLNSSRVAKRSQGGKQLSYLEAWDVKAHLTRIFGFGNWDSEIIREQFMGYHPYKGGKDGDRDMVEVMWQVTLRLTITTLQHEDDEFMPTAAHVTTYAEAAVGSATGAADSSGRGDLHDNAIKQAASDALKRCAINLGTQFGLSLYDNGSTRDIIKRTLVKPDGVEQVENVTPEQAAALSNSVGSANVGSPAPGHTEAQQGQAVEDHPTESPDREAGVR